MAYANGTRQWHTDSVAQRTRTKTEFATAPPDYATDSGEPLAIEVHGENAEERIRQSGPGAEILRRVYAARFRSYAEALYDHGSLVDLIALCMAFDEYERHPSVADASAPERAIFIESILKVLSLPSEELPTDP